MGGPIVGGESSYSKDQSIWGYGTPPQGALPGTIMPPNTHVWNCIKMDLLTGFLKIGVPLETLGIQRHSKQIWGSLLGIQQDIHVLRHDPIAVVGVLVGLRDPKGPSDY